MRAATLLRQQRPGYGDYLRDPRIIVPWHTCIWADGPKFRSRGIASFGSVGTWDDESENGRDFVQAAGANQPVYVPGGNTSAWLRGRPLVWFNAASVNQMRATFSAISQPTTVVLIGGLISVVQGTTYVLFDGDSGGTNRNALLTWVTSTPDGWWLYGGGGTINSGGVADATAQMHCFVSEFNGANSNLYIDRVLAATGNAGTAQLSNPIIGAAYNVTLPANMYVGFFGIINRLLTVAERAMIDRFAQRYYGVPSPLP